MRGSVTATAVQDRVGEGLGQRDAEIEIDLKEPAPEFTAEHIPSIRTAPDGVPVVRKPIRNFTVWRDTDGKPISCHDGGITTVGDTFYWYGTSYRGNATGLWGRKAAALHNGFNCYSSKNLVDWKYEGVCLAFPKDPWLSLGTCHRPNVLRCPNTGKYVMWFFCIGTAEPEYPAAMLAVAVADQPAGPFRFLGQRNSAEEHGWGQDLGLFQDADGKGYIVYDDGHGLSVGRCVWTDPSGDRVFSRLQGESLASTPAPSPLLSIPPGTPALAAGVVQSAVDVMGSPYVWGGSDANGFDCSGLVQYAYGLHGVLLPRTSRDQATRGTEVGRDLDALRPGDILTFAEQGSRITHVGLYVGDGQFIHSSSRGVLVSRLRPDDPDGAYWWRRWHGARRVLPPA